MRYLIFRNQSIKRKLERPMGIPALTDFKKKTLSLNLRNRVG